MKRGRKRKYTLLRKERLEDLYHNQKLKISEIETSLDASYPTIRKALEFHGIPLRPKDYPWKEQCRQKHGMLLRQIHAQSRNEKMKNDGE